jgi:alcohol dehydrogenase, propanol-preferring
MAIQLLRVLAPVRIVAADVDEKKLEQANALGADDVVNNRNVLEAAEQIQKITGPRGAGLVLDCVGVQPTLELGTKLSGATARGPSSAWAAAITIFITAARPYGTSVSIPYWGSRVELMEVIAMARGGQIHAETTEFPLTHAVDVYGKLKAGEIKGRAVLIPEGAAA